MNTLNAYEIHTFIHNLLASVTTVSAGGYYFPVKIIQIEIDSTDELSFIMKVIR